MVFWYILLLVKGKRRKLKYRSGSHGVSTMLLDRGNSLSLVFILWSLTTQKNAFNTFRGCLNYCQLSIKLWVWNITCQPTSHMILATYLRSLLGSMEITFFCYTAFSMKYKHHYLLFFYMKWYTAAKDRVFLFFGKLAKHSITYV